VRGAGGTCVTALHFSGRAPTRIRAVPLCWATPEPGAGTPEAASRRSGPGSSSARPCAPPSRDARGCATGARARAGDESGRPQQALLCVAAPTTPPDARAALRPLQACYGACRRANALRRRRVSAQSGTESATFALRPDDMALTMSSSIVLGARAAAPAKRSAPSGRVAAAKAAMPCKSAELRASAASAFVAAAPVRSSRAVARRASARAASVTTSAFKARSGLAATPLGLARRRPARGAHAAPPARAACPAGGGAGRGRRHRAAAVAAAEDEPAGEPAVAVRYRQHAGRRRRPVALQHARAGAWPAARGRYRCTHAAAAAPVAGNPPTAAMLLAKRRSRLALHSRRSWASPAPTSWRLR
jgi:hypothetical protein